jgi:Holliday junction resolvasome RuvABC endonuclease subunit
MHYEPRVIGLDLSLTSTGVASSLGWTRRITTKPNQYKSAFARLREIRSRVRDCVRNADLVVVEGLAIGSQTGQHLTRAGLWHLVMESVDAAGIPWTEVPPATLKRYATGRGNAAKDAVLLSVAKRFPDWDVTNADEADALVLAAMGADQLGHPLAEMPATHRNALDKVRWPEGLEGGQ